jgi:uncharacterized membrane protein YdbT with pleckstrin-like domain
MRYIDESLAADETILWRGRWPTLFWVGAWAALLLLGIAIVGIVIFARAAVIMLSTDFAVTERRVISKRGWLNRKTEELSVGSIEGVIVDQSFFARLFSYGRVTITGTGDAVIAFPPMANPVGFRRAIEEARAMAPEIHLAAEDKATMERAAASKRQAPPSRDATPRKRHGFIGLGVR